MTVGSLVYALALAGLSMSQGPVSYLACWAVLGVASSLALSIPSSIAIVQVAGPARAAGDRHADHHRRLCVVGLLADHRRARRRVRLAPDAADLRCHPSAGLRAGAFPGAAAPAAGASAQARRHRRRDKRHRAVRALARLPAAVDQPLLRRLRLHRRAGPHDRDPARPGTRAGLRAAARLADRTGAGRHPHLRDDIRPSLLDHALGGARLGHAAGRDRPRADRRRRLRRGAGRS